MMCCAVEIGMFVMGKPATGIGTTNPPYRPVDPSNPYAAPKSDDWDRLLDEMQ